MVMRRTFRFMLSQPSTDFSSAMRLSSSSWMSVGATTPASGKPIGPQRFFRNSNGSGGWFMRRGALRAASSLLSGTQKLQHLGAARHGVLITQIDQRPAVPLLEEQIACEVRAVAIHCADASQEEAHRPWQLVYVADYHALDGLAGRDHQHLDLPQRQPRLPKLLWSDEADGAIDSLHQLDIDVEAVQKNTVQGVPGDLRQRRIEISPNPRGLGVRARPAGAHHEHPVGAQVQRGADRRDLAHRSVPEILAVDFHRGKYEGQSGGSHQMLDPDRHRR